MRSLLFRLRLRHAVSALGALGMASGCVAGVGLDSGKGPAASDAGRGRTTTVLQIDAGVKDAAPPGDGGSNPHCGTAGFCGPGRLPDDRLACADHDAGGSARPNKSLDASALPDGGVGPDAQRDGGRRDAGDGGPDASGFGTGPDAGEAGVRAEALPVPAPLPPLSDAGPHFSCQVARDSSGGPIHTCLRSGLGETGSPCASVSDCAPGLACVGDKAGQCFRYCCDASTPCDPQTFCAERPLLDGTAKQPLMVPVCTPGEPCGLLEPFPCEGAGCSCPDTTTCAIVRGDGTRGCVTPGTGKVSDPCPCAAGYYCSAATLTCVKMCKTDGIDPRCSPGKCQAAAGFPQGFGLCVGYAPTLQ